RDDGDVARRRMRDDVTYVLFRVEAAVTPRLAGFGIDVFGGGGAGGHAPRADLRELRIRVDGDAPALVVREVPVQHVELVQRHPVEHALHGPGRDPVARRVQHQPAPGEARLVVHYDGGQAERVAEP